eukprot:8980323-Alexandrium_andersonii.AAC.1
MGRLGPRGLCSCGGVYLGQNTCSLNCADPEGPGRRHIRAEMAARQTEQAAREARERARAARWESRQAHVMSAWGLRAADGR